jgi:hypothetical protein
LLLAALTLLLTVTLLVLTFGLLLVVLALLVAAALAFSPRLFPALLLSIALLSTLLLRILTRLLATIALLLTVALRATTLLRIGLLDLFIQLARQLVHFTARPAQRVGLIAKHAFGGLFDRVAETFNSFTGLGFHLLSIIDEASPQRSLRFLQVLLNAAAPCFAERIV